MPRPPAVCGTRSKYAIHIRSKEIPCEPCKDANRAYKQQYNLVNSIKIAEYAREYQKQNKDVINLNSRRWRENNPERRKEVMSRYWANNPEKRREAVRRRRAKRNSSITDGYTDQQVLEEYGTDCHLCGNPIDLTAPKRSGVPGWENGLHIDHLTPISKLGDDTLENVRPAHGKCNVSRNARDLSGKENKRRAGKK